MQANPSSYELFRRELHDLGYIVTRTFQTGRYIKFNLIHLNQDVITIYRDLEILIDILGLAQVRYPEIYQQFLRLTASMDKLQDIDRQFVVWTSDTADNSTSLYDWI